MNLEPFQLQKMLNLAAELGAMNVLKQLEPANDYISKSELMQWMKSLKKKPSQIEKLIREGRIQGERKNKNFNSPMIFSKVNIKSSLFADEAYKILNF